MLKNRIKLEKFRKALISLEAIYLQQPREDRSNIDATIQRFEFTFELGWKCLKDHFMEQGVVLNFPKEVIQKAYEIHFIDDETLWLKMLHDRNMTSHTYDEKLADAIVTRIKSYVPKLRALLDKIDLTL